MYANIIIHFSCLLSLLTYLCYFEDLETQLAGLKSRLRQVEEEHEQTSKEHMIALQKVRQSM